MTEEKYGKLGRWALGLTGVLILIGVSLAGLETASLGFPDGHLTELERFYDRFAPWTLTPAAMWALAHMGLAISSLPLRHPRLVPGLLALDVLLIAFFWVAHGVLTRGLDHGAGG